MSASSSVPSLSQREVDKGSEWAEATRSPERGSCCPRGTSASGENTNRHQRRAPIEAPTSGRRVRVGTGRLMKGGQMQMPMPDEVPDARCQMPGARCQVPDARCQVLCQILCYECKKLGSDAYIGRACNTCTSMQEASIRMPGPRCAPTQQIRNCFRRAPTPFDV